MSHHHVKRHRWVNGTLTTYTNSFESLQEAKDFAIYASTFDNDGVRIYNNDGECVHEEVASSFDTYA
jgi:hypothetical protein